MDYWLLSVLVWYIRESQLMYLVFNAIEYLGRDELLEVTPLAYRIRKQILSAHDRGKLNKSGKKAALEAEG